MPKRHDTLRAVKERIEEAQREEVFPESPSDSGADEAIAQEIPQDPAQPESTAINWLRLAYSIEFLLALLAVLTLWSEIGGQSHLDMMPWYTKLICLIASAWCCVRFTAGLVEERRVWNRRTRVWLTGLILVATAMGAITYYYHLHEETDEQDSEETATAIEMKLPLALPME
jgi:hypothetical protein